VDGDVNVSKEAGDTARSAIDALSGSPALLAVILLQVLTMGMIYLVSTGTADRQQERELMLLNACFPMKEKI
jgi:hypothetical protein